MKFFIFIYNRYFFQSNFAGVNRLLVLAYLNEDVSEKDIRRTYQKELLRTATSSSMERTLMTTQLILM